MLSSSSSDTASHVALSNDFGTIYIIVPIAKLFSLYFVLLTSSFSFNSDVRLRLFDQIWRVKCAALIIFLVESKFIFSLISLRLCSKWYFSSKSSLRYVLWCAIYSIILALWSKNEFFSSLIPFLADSSALRFFCNWELTAQCSK